MLVRADGDHRIGLGHVMRTMAIADTLQRTGLQITYASRPLPAWAETLLRERDFGLTTLNVAGTLDDPEADAQATLEALAQSGADGVLLDHYGLTGAWTAQLKADAGVFIAAFDDLATDARAVDVLIDASPGRAVVDYAGLLPNGAVCLTGPDYAPLRPEFAAVAGRAPSKAPETSKPCRIAISMGGVDPGNVTLACLKALSARADVEVTVILSSAAPHLAAVQARIATMHAPATLLLDCTDMARVLQGMDLVIGAGGMSALERCALGLPSVLAVLADNQRYNAANLARAGAVVVLPDLSAETIARTVAPLIEDARARAAMGRAAAGLCDGLGAPRVAAAIVQAWAGVHLRPVTEADMAQIHAWQSEPHARQFARNAAVPTLEEHAGWFAHRLALPAPFYIVVSGARDCGFVRLDPDEGNAAWEVSIMIGQLAQGRGLGRAALGLLRLLHPRRKITATVLPENSASQRLFQRAGYQQSASDRFVSAGWFESVERQRDEH